MNKQSEVHKQSEVVIVRDSAGYVVHACGGMLFKLFTGALWCIGCGGQWSKDSKLVEGRKNELHS